MAAAAAAAPAAPPASHLTAYPPNCQFDVTVSKAADGALGLNIREATLMGDATPHEVVRIVGFKQSAVAPAPAALASAAASTASAAPASARGPSPVEASGHVHEGDIIVGVGNESVLGLRFRDVIDRIRASPRTGVRLRILRPEAYAVIRGITTLGQTTGVSMSAATLSQRAGYAALVIDGTGVAHEFGS
jgi:hypothetical protein